MKKHTNFSVILLMVSFFFFCVEINAQVYYDDWPIIRKSNDESKDNSVIKIDEDSRTANFVPMGTEWDHRIITYFFQNGTGDIVGDGEQQAIRDGFALWSAQTDLAFLEVCNANVADIVILWDTFAHGDPDPPCIGGACDFDGQANPATGTGVILAHALGGPPPNDFGDNAGDIHFDDSENWTLNTRGNHAQPIDLVTVAAHEIGHSLGLDHTTVAGSLMEAIYTGSHRFLGADDIAGIQSIYGLPNGGALIDGPAALCSTGSYTIQDVPAGISVS